MLQSKQASGLAALLPTRELAPSSTQLTDAIEGRRRTLRSRTFRLFPFQRTIHDRNEARRRIARSIVEIICTER